MQAALTERQQPITVAELSAMLKNYLEGSFANLLVIGEISDFKCYVSGHWYFTLKDETSAAHCVIYKYANARVSFTPRNGMRVVVGAKLSYYGARGDTQLIVSWMQLDGEGQLIEQMRMLEKKLSREGVFANEREIPPFPIDIAVVTSKSGAVFSDFVRNVGKVTTVPLITLYPSLVQGRDAPRSVSEALRKAYANPRHQVIVVARGGGSAEDLFCFNDELLVRTVAASPVPVISAVGHETDHTLCDEAADVRVATPTEAASAVVWYYGWLRGQLGKQESELVSLVGAKIAHLRSCADSLAAMLDRYSPIAALNEKQSALDLVSERLVRAMSAKVQTQAHRLDVASSQFERLSPAEKLREKVRAVDLARANLAHAMSQVLASRRLGVSSAEARFATLKERLTSGRRADVAAAFSLLVSSMKDSVASCYRNLDEAVSRVNALNPLSGGKFGKTITSKAGKDVRSADELAKGDIIKTIFADGYALSVVEKIVNKSD